LFVVSGCSRTSQVRLKADTTWMRRIALISIIVAGLSGDAWAQTCTCARLATPCGGFSSAAAVFVGRVESVARTTGARAVTLRVTESFRGTSADTVVVVTGQTGPQCAVPFKVGREYFVYAARADESGALTTNRCSRTREIEDAAADLTFARALEQGSAPPGRISGQVLLGRRGVGRSSIGPETPLAGITVRIVKDGAAEETVTNQAGDFMFDRRAPGVHLVSVSVPDRFYSDDPPARIELGDAHSCHEIFTTLYDNGRLAGRMIDASGRPVAGLTVELTTTNGVKVTRTVTDRDGRYRISRVSPGRFHVVVNDGTSRASVPQHPRLFYPGVATIARATRVVVGAEELVTLGDFRIPADITYVSMAGVVFDSDGVPAEGARIYLKGAGEDDVILAEPAVADTSGRFVIAAIAGHEYQLFAERRRLSSRPGSVDSTDQVRITVTEGMKPIRLTLRRRY
jgi:hypothetical protein